MVNLFMKFEGKPNAQDLLCSEIRCRYPTVEVGRPSRIYDTISRLVGPTRPSLRGPAKLSGSPLASYRKRIWLPRIRNTNAGNIIF